MHRYNINLGEFEYICDLYTPGPDYSAVIYKEFVILRNVEFKNNIGCDTDIFFIEKSIFEEIKSSNNSITDKIAFPCYNNKFSSFSRSYTDFSNFLNPETFKLEKDGGNVFSLYKYKNGEYTDKHVKIQCDKLRIYHPYNKTDLDYIIYVDNVINGIHFHYFCNYAHNYESNAETEFKVHNNYYSEYIDVYIPSIDSLFKRYDIVKDNNGNIIEDYNIYFNDIYNITKYIDEYEYDIKQKSSSWISINDNNKTFFEDNEMLSMVPLYLLLNPYIVNPNEDGVDEKIYFRLTFQECNNYNSFPLNITLFPYEFSNINNSILINQKYYANSNTYVQDYYFRLTCKLGFAHNQLCVINKFDYINKKTKDNPNGLDVQDAYIRYNGLTPYTYIDDNGNELKCCKEYIGWVNTDSEYEEESMVKLCGYQIDIATDYTFSNILFTDYQEMLFINDFEFGLLHIFDNWYNIPETMVIRVKYIDKYLGITLRTGYVILNKEWIKYTINSSNTSRIISDFKKNEHSKDNIMSWNKLNAKETNFTFVNKINCVVKQENNSTKIVNGTTNGVKIIYKPIFYKTQDLQFITLKKGFRQKVGINLSQYMTKVEVFKLIIDNMEITEYGRNDIYVIFEVNSGELENLSGTYSIVNNNDEYISSGEYIVS